MKSFILTVTILGLFFLCGVCTPQRIYAQDLSITQRIQNVYDDFLKNETVSNFISSVKSGWKSFKNWFNNLPGIRHYNNSIYSSKNWKKTMNDMGGEYRTHLQKDSAGVNMVKEGKKNWDKF